MNQIRPLSILFLFASLFFFGFGCSSADLCADIDCGGNGTCSVVDDEAICECDEDFIVSTADSLQCIEDPCLSENCAGNGTCSVEEDEALCTCDAGFTCDFCSLPEGDGVAGFEGSCFVFYQQSSIWDDADQGCFDLGAHLAQIKSEEENAAALSSIPDSDGGDFIWIGLQKTFTANFEWSLGDGASDSDVSFTNWETSTGQPDGDDVVGIRESSYVNEGEWVTLKDFQFASGRLCEIEE